MSGSPMRDLAVDLIVDLDQMCEKIDGRTVFKNQLLRSGASVGANIHEAKYAQSDADFISKFEIALKECYETEYWLELMLKADILNNDIAKVLLHDCGSIRRMLVSSINTMKNKE